MAIRRSQPIPFRPSGVTDTIDGSNSPPGAMAALTNLIPDPSTAGVFVCRPAVEELTDFTGFTTPAFVSALHVRGTLIYGMIASARFAGKDEPFCYDTDVGAFIAVANVLNANTPTSPATSGAWQPPIIAAVGVYLIVTHPGFPGGVGPYFGWIDITNPAAPVWDAGNTVTNPLPTPPVSVAQFNGRAWYAVDNTLWYSDALVPLTITNSSQKLTLGDNVDVTALGGLPLQTQQGGIIQSLIAFKGSSIMYQIKGDAATSDLSLNTLDVSTGTEAPNSIAPTPKGLAFMSPTGLRVIDFFARVSDPIGVSGSGVVIPFMYSSVPSRMAAAYSSDVYRITSQNDKEAGNPQQEWWFDFPRQIWTGPHTSAASLIHGFMNNFVLTLVGVNAKLWQSAVVQASSSTFEENGTDLEYLWKTSLLPDTEQMAENAMVETTIAMALLAGFPSLVVALSDQGSVIDQVSVVGSGTATIWGAFTWGSATWGGSFSRYTPRPIFWTVPIVFKKIQLQATGDSDITFSVGNMYMRYQILKYLLQPTGN